MTYPHERTAVTIGPFGMHHGKEECSDCGRFMRSVADGPDITEVPSA